MGTPRRLTDDFSAETLQAIRQWHDIFKVMKGKNLQPRLLYSARISLRFDGRNQKLYRQAKAKRIQHHQSSSTTNAKGTSLSGKHEKKRTYKNKRKTIKKMVRGTYILIIILNVNGLNAPTKRLWLTEWIRKQDPYICCL